MGDGQGGWGCRNGTKEKRKKGGLYNMRTYTTSIRCGSTFSQKHNNRDEKTMQSEKEKEEGLGLKFHIREDEEHKTFIHRDIKEAYKKIFNDALTEYNEMQISKGHKERCITDYYEHIKKDKKHKLAFEIIVQVGNKDNPVDEKTQKEIYEKYLTEWKERNPHFYIIGCYYHNDEGTKEKHTGHLHIDYIPIAMNCGTSLKRQCNQKQAFKELGIEGTKSRTPQMIWQERENNALIQICNDMGVTIKNPKENAQRISRTVYALKEQVKELEEQNEALKEENNKLIEQNQEQKEQNTRLYEAFQNMTKNIKPTVDYIENQLKGIDGTISYLEQVQQLREAKENGEELREISKQLNPTEHKKEGWGLVCSAAFFCGFFYFVVLL